MRLIHLLPFAALGLLSAALPPRSAADEVARAKELLKSFAGTWDCEATFMGMPPSKGVETNKLLSHGLCVVSEYHSPMMPGQEYEGHGFLGYDPGEGKWIHIWADNTDPSISMSEGTWNEEGTVFTVEDTIDFGTGPMTMLMVNTLQADGTRSFVMNRKDAAATDTPMARMTYRKRAEPTK
jgi:Protein of unknown function (DUF1579)